MGLKINSVLLDIYSELELIESSLRKEDPVCSYNSHSNYNEFS